MGTTASSTELNLQAAHPDHAYALARVLRDVDKFEIHCAFPGKPLVEALRYGIETSHEAFVICEGDQIHGIWGHGPWGGGPMQPDAGFVWMVSDNELFKRWGKTLTKVARTSVFPRLDQVYPSGYGNYVYKRNPVHLRWLSSCGFSAYGTWPVSGHPFSLMLRK